MCGKVSCRKLRIARLGALVQNDFAIELLALADVMDALIRLKLSSLISLRFASLIAFDPV